MKHIEKGPEPQEFTDWKDKANADWQPSYSDLRGSEKAAVTNALMQEQGYICCYCERRLTDEDSHIEHLRPQSMEGVDPLDFSNMLRSCQRNEKPTEALPHHCGSLKDHWYDEDLFVSPLDPKCEAKFSFLGNGEIQPTEDHDKAAFETRKRLGLGIPKLNALRRQVIEGFLDTDLSDDDFNEFVKGYLQPSAEGMFGEFYTTIRYLFS